MRQLGRRYDESYWRYVTAWDVVNEAIPEAVMTVKDSILCQSAKNVSAEDAKNTSTGKITWVTKTMCALLWLLPVSIMPRMVVLIL
jgi:hypothetical protein